MNKVVLRLMSLLALLSFSQSMHAQRAGELRAAAQQGDAKAMVQLAEKFEFGDGVAKSADSAAYWIQQAAKLGDPSATYLLGIQKCSRIFDSKSFTQGMALLNQSADSGNANAMMKLSEIWTDKTTDDESAKYNSATKGFTYLLRAAEAGLTEAMHRTGDAYANARGVTKSDSAAIHWYQAAIAKSNYIPSRLRLADFHFQGRGFSQPDYWAALELYRGVRYDPVAGTDSKADAEIGIHKVDQVLKRAHLLHLQGQGMVPTGTFDYRLRQ